MFVRALAAFLILPGMAAGLVPWLIASFDPWQLGGWKPGIIVLFLGLFLLLRCVRDFYVVGKGTLAPWDPPRKLVVLGLYCYTRNPMYVGVLTLLVGWMLTAGSPLIAAYTCALAAAFHLRVVLNEEPWLAGQFPVEWAEYAQKVPRWVLRLPQPPD